MKQACRVIKIIDFLKQSKLDELKEDHINNLKLQSANSNGSNEEDKKDPEQIILPQILSHMNQVDYFGNTSIK